jgi:hypothetical protein
MTTVWRPAHKGAGRIEEVNVTLDRRRRCGGEQSVSQYSELQAGPCCG